MINFLQKLPYHHKRDPELKKFIEDYWSNKKFSFENFRDMMDDKDIFAYFESKGITVVLDNYFYQMISDEFCIWRGEFFTHAQCLEDAVKLGFKLI